MNKKPLLLFGAGKIAEVIAYYAENECGFRIEAFVCDAAHISSPVFLNRPVVAFEDLDRLYPASQFDVFVALGYHEMNRLREHKLNAFLSKGYNLVSIVSPSCNLAKNITYGYNCFIMPPAIIHPCVSIGNNVFVWSGAMIGHHSKIGNHNWFTSCSALGGNVLMGNNCFLAMQATVSNQVTIGNECFLGANTLVTKNMQDGQVVISESSKPIKLTSKQFLRLSTFSSI